MDRYDEKRYIAMSLKMLYEQGIHKDVNAAMEEYEKLQGREQELHDRYDELREEWYQLLKIGKENLYKTNPEIEVFLTELGLEGDNKFLNTLNIHKEMDNAGPEMQTVLKAFKEIPELIEANQVCNEMERVGFEYWLSYIECRTFYAKCRDKFFTEDYKEKLDYLAKEGIFLYNYFVPNIPVCKVPEEDILEHFFEVELPRDIADQKALKHKGISLDRKIEDLIAAYNLICDGYYRSATRNLLSLIEAEHKKGAEALEGLFQKEEKYKNGKERSKKLNEILSIPGMEWEKHSWEKIEKYYQKVFANDPTEGVIHRNSIMHGDYNRDSIEVTRCDAIKLFTIFISIRYVSNSLCRAHENIEIIMPYVINALCLT